jgi:hypothetical protein
VTLPFSSQSTGMTSPLTVARALASFFSIGSH